VVTKVTRQHTKEEVLALLDPLFRRWFEGKFKTLTEPQAYAVPLIHQRKNVLISSPTGSGKTLTAFLSILNELYGLQRRGELEDRIYAVYISPLKALANDINRNLTRPLEEMREIAAREGLDPPEAGPDAPLIDDDEEADLARALAVGAAAELAAEPFAALTHLHYPHLLPVGLIEEGQDALL